MATLSVHEAAQLMKVHPQTVLDLIGGCAIPAAKVGRAYVMLERDVMNYLDRLVLKQTEERMKRQFRVRGV